ncbi:AraC family transcriptional regulator [Dictyobacter alpinus]|uniref:AraC family transcriptional regulator n=1 Tax=Dictyobacter alpinus TaxID=2014873 RepID=A0A402B2X5_9CHLR|nr:AraC family transcriptional regulator [Dictyobacter alpinus]GCE25704.1 AraC family transcriptional regulator [Dictyobacter alpinus]
MSIETPRPRFTKLNDLPLSLQLGSYHSELLGWGFFEPRYWRNYLHLHSCFEVCYAFQGEGSFRAGSTLYEIHAGDVFIARPGVSHEIISAQEQPLGIYFWSYSLTPGPRQSVSSQSDERISAIDNLLAAFGSSKDVVSARTSAMLPTLELLTQEIANQNPGYSQIIEGLVTKLLLDTARSVVDDETLALAESQLSRNPDRAIVQVIVRYIRDNYSQPLSIRDLAAQVHLSERHTCRLFQKETGETMMAYLTKLRLDIASQLLLEQQIPLKEIAQSVGYPDVRYFITLFRQKTGQTPTTFRQQGGTTFL